MWNGTSRLWENYGWQMYINSWSVKYKRSTRNEMLPCLECVSVDVQTTFLYISLCQYHQKDCASRGIFTKSHYRTDRESFTIHKALLHIYFSTVACRYPLSQITVCVSAILVIPSSPDHDITIRVLLIAICRHSPAFSQLSPPAPSFQQPT